MTNEKPKMDITDVLKLLYAAKEYKIERSSDGYGYDIADTEHSLAAFIPDGGKARYFVTGAYNSGIDWLEIDVKALDRLRSFCESLSGATGPKGEK